MERLADLLNHGTLPFVGRKDELARLAEFWRGTFEAQELRTMLIVGEAGMGKSRLLDEATPIITGLGGLIVRIKVYPETESSTAALITGGLWMSTDARRLLKSEPQPTVHGVVSALRRLSRVRPLLLIIEDIHLLSGDSAHEFSTFVNAIAEETLALLCVARPVQTMVRPAIERFLVDELSLGGLTDDAIGLLWRALFDYSPDPQITTSLVDTTARNPLALRTALRNVVRSKHLVQNPHTLRWEPRSTPDEFGARLRATVDLLAEGMVSHLTAEERQVAEQIACLGEVCARESAEALVANAGTMMNHLIYKGIIAPAPIVTPHLPGSASGHAPLAFSHTLLHEHLAASAGANPTRMLRIVARGLPLYSIRAFQFPRPSEEEMAGMIDEVVMAIGRTLQTARALDSGPQWKTALGLSERSAALFEAIADRLPPQQRRELEADIMHVRLALMRRSAHTDEYRALVDRMLELTSEPESHPMRQFRIWAYYFLSVADIHVDYRRCGRTWEQVHDLVRIHPELRATQGYHHVLHNMAQFAWRIPDRSTIRLVEKQLNELLLDDTIPQETRTYAWKSIAPQLLLLFDSADELAGRLRLQRDLSTSSLYEDSLFLLNSIMLLADTGYAHDALRLIGTALPKFRANGNARNIFHASLLRLCSEIALGKDLHEVEAVAETICATSPSHLIPAFRRNIAIYLCEAGLLRGDLEWAESIVRNFAPDEREYWPERTILVGIAEERLADVATSIPEEEERVLALKRLAIAASVPDEPSEQTAADIRFLLSRESLVIDDLLTLHATVALCQYRNSHLLVQHPTLRPEAASAVSQGLKWLAERSLFAYMAPLLERGGTLLPRKEQATWRPRIRELQQKAEAQGNRGHSRMIRISMLDTVAVALPGEESQPVRGARQRAMLGLLVASEIVRRPLSPQEFRRIAADNESDPDLARKTANMAIVRLREALGPQAIETGKEIHRLNRAHVRVDLLDLVDLLNDARDALRDGALIRTVPAMLRALDLMGRSVPFPGLYDDFFEALREDIENRLRETLIDLADTLLREGDVVGAEQILQRGFSWMPDDEEIADLLRRALVALNQRAEAERVRMQADTSVDIYNG